MMEFTEHGIKSFKGLTIGILQVMVQGMEKALQAVVEELDEGIPHPGRGWESVGKRERRLETLFGLSMRISRRGYRWRGEQGKKPGLHFPLDDALGLVPEERFCPLVQHLAVSLATDLSFRKVAALLKSVFNVTVSHQQVHRWVQEAGEEREREEAGKVAAAFAQGEVPAGGERAVPAVMVEADGVMVRLQRERRKWLEFKLGVMHEGWEPTTPSGKRLRLKEKACWGGDLTPDAFWERGVVTISERCDPSRLERVVINGDGASWIKASREHLTSVELYLDPFHRNKALTYGLQHAPALLAQARAAIEAEDLDQLAATLRQAVATAVNPEAQKRAQETRSYLEANWDALGDWRKRPGPQPVGAKALGTMESQVRHIAAVRMKRNGTSWCTSGANHMLQLRLLSQSGALHSWLDERGVRRWTRQSQPINGKVASTVVERLSTVDPAAWLRAGIPYLRNKSANTPLGRALKSLSSIQAPA